jgi:hypothetical protein
MEAGKDEALLGILQQRQEIGLLRKRGEQGDGGGAGPSGVALYLGEERAGACLPRVCRGFEPVAHQLAEGCFGDGEFLWG